MEENQALKQQKKEEKQALKRKRKEQEKLDKMKKRSRCRHLKNFLWWLTGVLTPAILLVIVIAVGTFLIPISTYFKWAGIENPNDYVSEEIANKNLFNGINGVTEYTMEDVPAVRLLINTLSDTLSEIDVNGNAVIKVDRQKLESLGNYKIIDDVSELFEDYVSCLSVVVTISDLGVDLGDIGKIPTINTFEEIIEDSSLSERLSSGTPLQTPQLYYFDANQLSANSGGATTFSTTQQTPDYRRAFKNDSNFVDELSTLNAEQINALTFYYPALDHVPAVDFMYVFGPRFKMTSVVSVLNLFAPVEEDGLFNKILGDETIETIGSLDMTDIKLVDVLDPPSSELPGKDDPDYETKMEAYNRNREIYDILKDCTGKNSYEEISLSDLTNMNTNDIVLADFIEAPTSDTPCEKPVAGDPDYENKMEAYNAYHKNRKLYDILLDASDITFESCETYRTLKLKHLQNINIDHVKLVTVIEAPSTYKPSVGEENYQEKLDAYNQNREIYSILLDATGKNSYDQITIQDLSSINVDNVILADILEAPTSDVKCEKPSADDPDYDRKMQEYDAYYKNRKLYDILLDASGIEFVNCSSYRQITVSSLKQINVDNIKLSTVLEMPSSYKPILGEENYQEKLDAYNRNRDLYNLLMDATNKTDCSDITLNDLSHLKIDNVTLANIFEAPTSDTPVEMPSGDDPDFNEKMEAYNAYHKNRKLYDILLDASGIEYENCSSYRQLKVSHLSSFDINNVKLTKALEAPSNYKPTLGEEDYDKKLEAYNKNRDIYNILLDSINDESVKEYDDITIGHLSMIKMDNVVLANIFEAPTSDTPVDEPDESDPNYAQKMEDYNAYHKNRKLYDILLDASGIEYEDCSSYRQLKVSHLNSFDINNVKLTKALEAPSDYKPTLGEENYQEKLDAYNKNRDIYNILLDSITDVNVDSYDDIAIGHLANINIDNVVLANIIDAPTSDTPIDKPNENDPNYAQKMEDYNAYHKNRKLYDILLDASGIEYEDCSSYRLLKVSHLNSFDINNVKLIKVIEPPTAEMPERNRDIYNILLDCVTDPEVDSYDDITLNHLSNVEIDNVKLSTVMTGSSNDIIQTLIDEDNARKDEAGYEPATLGNIGERINGLLVKDVYEVDCFTTEIAEAVNNPVVYYKSVGQDGKTVYSTTGTGKEYYVAKSSSVWLFMLFDAEDVDKTTFDAGTGLELHVGTGIANKYVEMDVTVKELKTRINVVSKNIMNATVRQVCDSGMLEGDYPKIYGLTFSDAIKRLNDLHP